MMLAVLIVCSLILVGVVGGYLLLWNITKDDE